MLSMTVASDLCRSAGAPLKIPPISGSNFEEKNHGHAALPKSYQIDELRSQTSQSHVSYTYSAPNKNQQLTFTALSRDFMGRYSANFFVGFQGGGILMEIGVFLWKYPPISPLCTPLVRGPTHPIRGATLS